MPSIFYLDYENGNDAADGSTFALGGLPAVGPWKTITNGATAGRIAPGDIIRIAKSPPPVSIGNATWTQMVKTVTLDTAQNLNIDLCEVIWTAANGASVALTPVATTAKEGAYCAKITAPGVPVVSTLYGYYGTGALNLASYQKITFWVRSSLIIPASRWKICLCSDAVGAVIVDTFQIPAIPSVDYWAPITLARVGGGNLGANINSIALYSDTVAPQSGQYLYLDDFVACTTDGLNLQSLISRNSLEQGGAQGWYGLKNINNAVLMLDNHVNNRANSGLGYWAEDLQFPLPNTGSFATYKRETIKTAMVSVVNSSIQEAQKSGTLGNNIQYQGGYDTALNTQIGETHFDALNGIGSGLKLSSKSYITINHLSFHRCGCGIDFATSTYNTIDTIHDANNCGLVGIRFLLGSDYNIINTVFNTICNSSHGIYLDGSNHNNFYTVGEVNCNYWWGLRIDTLSTYNYFGLINSVSLNWGDIFINTQSHHNTFITINYLDDSYYNGISILNECDVNYFDTIGHIDDNSDGGAYPAIYLYNCHSTVINHIGTCDYNSWMGIKFDTSNNNYIGRVESIYRNFQAAVNFVASHNNIIGSLDLVSLTTGWAIDFDSGLSISSGNIIGNIVTPGNNTLGGITNAISTNYILRGTVLEATKVSGQTTLRNARLYFHDVPTGLDQIYTDNGYIVSENTVRHTASGIAWQLSPTNVNRDQYYPLKLSIAKIAVVANKLVTVKAWFKKSHATDIAGKLVCKGLQLPGVATDVVAVKADDTDWEELTITFTPTEQGIIEIEAWAYWTANLADESVYVDDMTITQAS